jgi:predicted transcriptional regulator
MAMTVRFTEEQDSQLTALAEAWGVSKQQALVRAVEDMIASIDYENKKREGLDFVMSEYADVIKRLGE